MTKSSQLQSILKAIGNHPLARKHKARAYFNFVNWQLSQMLSNKEKVVSFTEKTCLVVKKGMTGATGNIYMGLHEFNDMSFVLHFLRPADIFFDIGANVGSYTILSSGHVGARTIAVEPVLSTFCHLKKNMEVNKIGKLVELLNIGIGSTKGKLKFTTNHDTLNHVDPSNESAINSVEVDVTYVDDLTREYGVPTCIKIDVEGYEAEVLNGMGLTLAANDLKAIIIELNGSGRRYGYEDHLIHELILSHGFTSNIYDPFKRKFIPRDSHGTLNTIYLRDIPFVQRRVELGEMITLFSESF